MTEDFDLERFIQNTIETVVWCRHVLDTTQCQQVVWPLTGDESRLWHLSDAEVALFCNFVITERAEKARDLNQAMFQELLPTIQQGRFMLFYPGTTTSDGVAKIEANGYFDFDNYPPWDTWIYFHSVQSRRRLSHLIAWVAPEFIDPVHGAIESCADQSIVWLMDDKPEYSDLLKSAHLWI